MTNNNPIEYLKYTNDINLEKFDVNLLYNLI